MAAIKFVILIYVINFIVIVKSDDELRDFDFLHGANSDEVMIAQESRQYHTYVKAPVKIIKPTGITNSHRPQYNIDSLEETSDDKFGDLFEASTKKSYVKDYKSAHKLRAKEGIVREAVLRALERREHVGRIAQVLPIVRGLSGQQRGVLASLVASQVTTPPGRAALNLAQVRSMFGNDANATNDLMLPILLDMANLIRRAGRSGKQTREVHEPMTLQQNRLLRRSILVDDDTELDELPFETGVEPDSPSSTTTSTPKQISPRDRNRRVRPQRTYASNTKTDTTKKLNRDRKPERNSDKRPERNSDKRPERNSDIRPERIIQPEESNITVANTNITTQANITNATNDENKNHNKTIDDNTITTQNETLTKSNINESADFVFDDDDEESVNASNLSFTKESIKASPKFRPSNRSRVLYDNSSIDLISDSTNQTDAQDVPTAEKLRAANRYNKGNSQIRRGTYPPKPPPVARRTTSEPSPTSPQHKRLSPPRKLPIPAAFDQAKCELFTNTMCLHAEDYPTEAIVTTIRRNKAAAGALLADFRDPGEGALDGVTQDQESKYTPDHYLESNRRGDTANRDFASAGEAGFMCPSTVKYARPQRARATSGQWKYIVNTGEHTQTLRLEKCLKPKESCTYLTDNFKSKCVQVYNYHRLLTWDQQNGLHMDIFKVPTCCSCHIEGYSVAFPPLGHRVQETSSENFPTEDISAEHGNHAFESVQSSNQRPSVTKSPPFSNSKPLETYPPFSDNHNLISATSFNNPKIADNDEYMSNIPVNNPMDSYGNNYYSDSFKQASTTKKNVKRPLSGRHPGPIMLDSMSLPSYLEPPTPSASASYSFSKEAPSKYKLSQSQYKRGANRPNRRPMRKKISGVPDDLMSSGTSALESFTGGASPLDDFDAFHDDLDDQEVGSVRESYPKRSTIAPKLPVATTEKITTSKPEDPDRGVVSEIAMSAKRVNYNYHPIIDFFEEGKVDNDSIDREDSEPTYVPAVESDWKPINQPSTINTHSTNLISHKKH